MAICLCLEVSMFWRVYVGKVIWVYYQIAIEVKYYSYYICKVEKAETAVSAYLDIAFWLCAQYLLNCKVAYL